MANVETLRTDASWKALLDRLADQIVDGVDGAIAWIENRMRERNEKEVDLEDDFM